MSLSINAAAAATGRSRDLACAIRRFVPSPVGTTGAPRGCASDSLFVFFNWPPSKKRLTAPALGLGPAWPGPLLLTESEPGQGPGSRPEEGRCVCERGLAFHPEGERGGAAPFAVTAVAAAVGDCLDSPLLLVLLVLLSSSFVWSPLRLSSLLSLLWLWWWWVL